MPWWFQAGLHSMCIARIAVLLSKGHVTPGVGGASSTDLTPDVHLALALPRCRSKDMTLKEAEVLALSTLKQVMEEKVGADGMI